MHIIDHMDIRTIDFVILLIQIHVVCSNIYTNNDANLVSVPSDIPTNSMFIYLKKNLIDNLDDNIFSNYTELRTLNLDDNRLSSVNQKAFEGLSKINTLHLAMNLLTTFPNLTVISGCLKYLNLKGNHIHNLPNTFIEPLQIFYLNENNISGTFVLPHLPYLRTLDISRNDIKMIPVNFFLNSTTLINVYLHENQIQIFPDLGKIGASLKNVFFNNNILEYILSTYLEGLTGLRRLNFQFNKLEEFPDFSRCGQNIEYLYFSNNKIKHIPRTHLEGLPKLKYLHLQNNMINGTFSFPSLPSLIAFHVSNNSINAIPVNDIDASNNIETINLSKTDIIVLPNITHLNYKLKHLYISNSKIDLSIYMPFLYGLEKLYIDTLPSDTLPSDLFSKVPNIKTIRAWFNGYTKMPHFGSSGHQYLNSADFSYNKIQSISMSSLRYLRHGTLKITNNHLVCDMTLCWLMDKQWPFELKGMKCKAPPALKNVKWSDVTLHNLICLGKSLH